MGVILPKNVMLAIHAQPKWCKFTHSALYIVFLQCEYNNAGKVYYKDDIRNSK